MENVKVEEREHTLMDEALVHEAAMEQFMDRQRKRIAKDNGFLYQGIIELHFEYKRIQRISNLWEFTSLVKLELNSNAIKKIEGLECLVNLKWLNLSVNCIEKIEGLESLQKLEVLNLTRNSISVIENMEPLKKLTHLYIAWNHIQELDSVSYLGMFEDLFTLNMCGNPVCEIEDYKDSVIKSIPNLMFLDNILINVPVIRKDEDDGSIKSDSDSDEGENKESQESQLELSREEQEAELRLHKDAYVEFLKGSHLFESMFEDDPETDTLNCVPGMTPLILTFKSQIVEQCEQLLELGLAEHERRESVLNSFNSGRTQCMAHFQQKASQKTETFLLQHNETVKEMRNVSDPGQRSIKLKQCHEVINQFSNDLMTLEFQLITRLKDSIKKFVINISAMIANLIETAQGMFVQCRDLEDNFYEKVKEIARAILEVVAKDDVDCYLPDSVKVLFKDKEAVMDALTIGHDNHLTKINDRETLLISRANAWKEALLKETEDKANRESQERMTEIHRYADYLKEQLQEAQQPRRLQQNSS